ncbi:MAG: hypothetical protein MJZ60_00700 [Bacteroidaceae bacterium]|nr:hypothetical protein [Bacteroidaceae bacterium]
MDAKRRKFLKISGSLAVGGLIFSAVGSSLWKMFTHPEQIFYDSKRAKADKLIDDEEDFVSPYRRTFGFEVPDEITAFEVSEGSLYVAMPNLICVYGMSGEIQNSFPIPSDLRDLTVHNGLIYALFATRIEVYSREGDLQQQWEACSENSDYCAFAVCEEGVFVTDAYNKNICKYNVDGTLNRFINSPDGFIVPSYSFAITVMNGKVFCSNPGRHKVEQYDTNGNYLASFGKSGHEPGAFSGCCNPVILTPANNGELLTSEKGIPRISCYSESGKFRSVLLDTKALGGGSAAYDVRILNDKLVVAGGNKVSVFQYNRHQSQQTACGQCDKDCPLKEGMNNAI